MGAITNRMAFFNEYLGDWRTRVFLGEASSLVGVADLGYGVLDAVVETAAYYTEQGSQKSSIFINLLTESDKNTSLMDQVQGLKDTSPISKKVSVQDLSLFLNLPANRFAYNLGLRWLHLIKHKPVHALYVGRIGISTGEDFRFFRLFWELSRSSVCSEHWRWVSKGGEFSRYHSDTHLKIDWRNELVPNQA